MLEKQPPMSFDIGTEVSLSFVVKTVGTTSSHAIS